MTRLLGSWVGAPRCQDCAVGTFGHGAAAADPVRPAPSSAPFPVGFELAADDELRVGSEGRVLLGGSPTRLIRLRPRAAAMVRGWLDRDPVTDRRPEAGVARRLVSAGVLHPRPPPGVAGAEVAAVVPVRDRPEALARLLASMGAVHCVVVDDCSLAGADIEKVARDAGAQYVRLERHSGAGAARNAGLARVGTPLVAFVDSDCTLPPDWLEGLVGHFADPKVAMVAPRVRAEGGRSALERYEAVASPLDLGDREARVGPGSRVSYVPSAAVVVRRAAVRARCFDERLETGEDVDLVWRLVDAGWDVRYVPAVVVSHAPEVRPMPWLARRAAYGSSAGPLALRHGDAVAPARVSPAVAAAWGLVAAGRPAAAIGVVAASSARLAGRLSGVADDPLEAAVRLFVEGAARSVVPTLTGLTRVWSPLLALGVLLRPARRLRAIATAALVLDATRGIGDRPEGMDPATYAGLRLADDLAYGAGVWWGCARARTILPLVPALGPWGGTRTRERLSPGSRAAARSPRAPRRRPG